VRSHLVEFNEIGGVRALQKHVHAMGDWLEKRERASALASAHEVQLDSGCDVDAGLLLN
jgi:hypothetical protein